MTGAADADETRALAALDAAALQADAAALLAIPSPTGDEHAALAWLAGRARDLGLRDDLHEHDLAALRAHPAHPGEEAPREALFGLTATLPGADPAAPRLAIDGHVDVVPPGNVPWTHPPGTVEGGELWGRGAVDMKGAVVAALHALGAVAAAGVQPAADIALLAVGSEEDGGLGTFAALERDRDWGACLIPEPTGWDVVCAQAGALTFTGAIEGIAAHAAERLHGRSAIDAYLPVHAALAAHERHLNADVRHPLMRELPLPYPLVVGTLEAGEWASTVPDRLVFRGRVGVRVGEPVQEARAALEHAVGDTAQITWSGGSFASGETDPRHPFAGLVRSALGDELGREPRLAGVPWGADMRLFCERGIPCVMAGTPGIDRAHAVDERLPLDDLLTLARSIVRVVCRWRG